MSYCRWSSMDFQCDIYCWHDISGQFIVSVAVSRHTVKDGFPPHLKFDDPGFLERYDIVSKMISNAEMVDIGLPSDGKTFMFDTAGEAADKLKELRAEGYNVPDFAIETLDEEGKEEGQNDDTVS